MSSKKVLYIVFAYNFCR